MKIMENQMPTTASTTTTTTDDKDDNKMDIDTNPAEEEDTKMDTNGNDSRKRAIEDNNDKATSMMENDDSWPPSRKYRRVNGEEEPNNTSATMTSPTPAPTPVRNTTPTNNNNNNNRQQQQEKQQEKLWEILGAHRPQLLEQAKKVFVSSISTAVPTRSPINNNNNKTLHTQSSSASTSAATTSTSSSSLPEPSSSSFFSASPMTFPSTAAAILSSSAAMTSTTTTPQCPYTRTKQVVNDLFRLLFNMMVMCSIVAFAAYFPQIVPITPQYQRAQLRHELETRGKSHNGLLYVPKHVFESGVPPEEFQSALTLRQFLTHPQGFHLAMAPAFFGFYAYFGILQAWDESIIFLQQENNNTTFFQTVENSTLESVSGASAGAMAAALLASGISPRQAIEFANNITLWDFADPPAIGAAFRGDKFEQLMTEFLSEHSPDVANNMEQAKIPVAVSTTDIQTMQLAIVHQGNMARAARASATFPLLFQPVGWKTLVEQRPRAKNLKLKFQTESLQTKDYLLMDGGIHDVHGLESLNVLLSSGRRNRVVNLVVGDFYGKLPPGPSRVNQDILEGNSHVKEIVSISIKHLPRPGPWAMKQGPVAAQMAMQAMKACLDLPMYFGPEKGHYELHIDAVKAAAIMNEEEEEEQEEEEDGEEETEE